MQLIQALLYLAAVVLLVIAAFPNRSRVSLAVLGTAAFILAYALPVITTAL
jgi:hypothetical protein